MFDAIFTPQPLLDEVCDRAWLQAMLDFERALAAAEAELGVIPAEAAEAIAAACRAELFDAGRIAAEGRGSGNPAEPLVRALRTAVGGDAAGLRASRRDEPGCRRHRGDARRHPRPRNRAGRRRIRHRCLRRARRCAP